MSARPSVMELTERPMATGVDVTNAFEWYLGIDWGAAEHWWCLLDARGEVVGTRAVRHDVTDVQAALGWVLQTTGAAPAMIAVGIESIRGTLVETIGERGFAVFAINPKQLDRCRDRFTAAGAKDDRRDAHVVADTLRTDQRVFRRIRNDDPITIHLREVCRLVEDLQGDELRLANRLREQLYRVDAAWLAFTPAADEPWLWSVLQETPHPDAWPRLSRRRVATVLHSHRIRRITSDEVMHGLRQPRLTSAAGVSDAVATRIAALVPQLALIRQQRLEAERQIDRLLGQLAQTESANGEPREHRDVEILRSLPGVGRIVAATMLTEAAAAVAARDYVMLRTFGGAAPVTTRSGKCTFVVRMRRACKRRVRQALYHWARTSVQHDPAAKAYYDRLRARGHHHARALRSVADRWLRILVAMLKAGTVYDPSRFAASLGGHLA